jgi:hypothetical protein
MRQPQDASLRWSAWLGKEIPSFRRGQRFGWMEFAALMAHGVHSLAAELLSAERSIAGWMPVECSLAKTTDARVAARLALNRYLQLAGCRIENGESSRPGFRGPVVELMGPLTISAGETFTQALMGRMPHVTRIGENTQGVFSDVLVRKLPNGWVFGLPNEVYRTSEGIAFDGPGISPDIAVPVFAASDVASGKDPEMERALQILRNK